jgi:hypothetical protein
MSVLECLKLCCLSLPPYLLGALVHASAPEDREDSGDAARGGGAARVPSLVVAAPHEGAKERLCGLWECMDESQ